MPGPARVEGAAKEFLVVAIPDRAEAGATLRLLAVEASVEAAKRAVAKLDPGTLGRIAVLERRAMYRRQQAVENVEIDEAIA